MSERDPHVPIEPTAGTRPTTLWPGLEDPEHTRWYTDRFRAMAADGQDLEGESRLVDVLAPRQARLLDAGCGPGRHGGHLARLGHTVVGVDIDPGLIQAAREDHPGPTWLVADLATLDLRSEEYAGHGIPDAFDGALVAGNVLDFVAQDHRAEAVRRVAAHLRPGGFLLVGCRTARGFTPHDLDAALPTAGLTLEQRFATWDLKPWREDADFCVSVLRAEARRH